MGEPPLVTQNLFGLDFVAHATIEAVARRLADSTASPAPPWRCVVTPNVDHLVRYERHPQEREVAEHAFVILPDGMPIVWASRLVGRRLDRRLTGVDLFIAMWPMLADAQIPTMVVSRDDDVAAQLLRLHPSLTCIAAPFFEIDRSAVVEQLVDDIVDAAERSQARFLFIGVSGSKAHVLASLLRPHWSRPGTDGPTVLLVGAAPEFYLGAMLRAPRWMQRSGLEWLHRLGREPLRLARRYLVDDVRFVGMVWREWRQRGGRPSC